MNKKEKFSLLFQSNLNSIKHILITILIVICFSFSVNGKPHSKKQYVKPAIGTTYVAQATYYGNNYRGYRHTANGDKFNMYAMTCASNLYSFGTYLKVENLHNKKSVIVKVTDRGAFKSKNLDLTYGAFGKIASHKAGRVKVRITVVHKP